MRLDMTSALDSETAEQVGLWEAGKRSSPRLSQAQLRAGDIQIPFRLAVPEQPDASRVLVLLHGISRNTGELIQAFWPAAQAAGYLLIAPLFSAETCPDFQRLGRWGRGPRIDLILHAILEQVSTVIGQPIERADWFGFSAGAQVAHRFAFAYPDKVRNLTLGAAGWYTLPNKQRYPWGLRLAGELPGICFHPERFLRRPVRVFVGAKDTRRDEALNTSARIDKSQGVNRLQRAENWVSQMNEKARQHGLAEPATLELMPGVGHSFRQACQRYALAEKIMHWLQVNQCPEKTAGELGQ